MAGKIINKIKHELKFGNTAYYTRISDKIANTYYKTVLKKKIASLQPIVTNKKDALLTLAILANKRNFFESIAAIYSFCFWNKDTIIHYHEDGTLTEADVAILHKVFPDIKVFRRKDQDVAVMNYLTNNQFTYCSKLRENFIFSLRLFDSLIEKKTPYLLQIDSDVLFFSRPAKILEIVEKGNANGCFNNDKHDAYSFTDDVLRNYLSVPMVKKFNAGLFLFNLSTSCFPFIEDVLKNELQSPVSWHMEQTLFAMCATNAGNYISLPQTYDLGRQLAKTGAEVISQHYVHNTGYNFHKDFIYKLYPLYQGKLN